MKVLAVFLTDASPEEPPVALFPLPDSETTKARIRKFIDLTHPGRPYELRELDVDLNPQPKRG